MGVSASTFVIAAGIGYLFKRRRTTQNDKDVAQVKDVAPLDLNKLSEMDGTRQVKELDGQEQGVPELEHKEPPVELQAPQYYHRD